MRSRPVRSALSAARLTLSVGAAMLVGTLLLTSTTIPPVQAAAGTRVQWQGANWYLEGANVPWFNWGCDFGCGTSGGVSDPSVRSGLQSAFSQLSASGAHTVRWWVFEGDAHQITRDGSGAPAGVDPAVYADFDAALALAQTYDLYYDFVLFNAPTAIPSSWINDPGQRSQLAAVLGTLFAHYKGDPHVLSWEVFNEPEFDIWNGKIAQAPVQATVQSVASAVHANSNAYVTVGSAMLDGLPMWTGLGLDYYEAHWYDYMSGGDFCARCTDYPTVQAKYGLDQPLVIGELYAGSNVDAYQRNVDFYNKGYAGAWPWSMFPSHTSDGLSIDFAAMHSFTSQHGDLGPRKGTVSTPTPTRTPTSTPTATPTPTPSTGHETITFDDLSNPDRPLDGQYPSGTIDWGGGVWWLSSPWGKFPTQSISFNGPDATSGTWTFVTPRRLIQLDAYNGDNASTTVTLSCGSQPIRHVSLTANQLATIHTNWTGVCSSVTLSTGNGWNTNFDNLVIQ